MANGTLTLDATEKGSQSQALIDTVVAAFPDRPGPPHGQTL